MKMEDIYQYLLVLSCTILAFVIYWRDVSSSIPLQSSGTQNNSTTATKTLNEPLKTCNEGFYFSQIDNACVVCENGTFSMKGWIGCLSWLNCKGIQQDLRSRRLLSAPSHINAVKHIFLADWYGYDVVYIRCAHQMFWDDCQHNLRMLKGLQGNEFVVQLIGFCEERQEVITTFYRYGSAEKLNELLSNLKLSPQQELDVGVRLARDYVKILTFLHNSPLGVRVMCDTNDLIKTLSQFLVTDELHLMVNDLDALPEVDHKSGRFIKCGHQQLFGWFVAPEQLWPYDDEPFDDNKMPGYDEKIDIWRIPDVVTWFLGDTVDGLKIKASLKTLFSQCKANNPKARPSAREALEILEKIIY